MMKRSSSFLLLALFTAAATCGEAPVELQGSGTYFRLQLPLAVQMQTRLPDLGDLQILNAHGDALPFAWAEEPSPTQTESHTQALPFFKSPGVASAVEPSQQGGWIVDARQVQGALMSLQLSLSPTAQGVYGLAVDAGNDLQHWQTLADNLQLVSLQRNGVRLENTRIELAGQRTRYLRLRTRNGSPPLPLAGVSATSQSIAPAATALQWSEPLAPTACTPEHCDYTLPRHLPLERVELQLTEPNTLAPLQWLVQDAPGVPATRYLHHHHLRGHLHGHLQEMRDKTAPADAQSNWYALAESTAYWLRQPEGDLRSPAVLLDDGLHAQLRLQPRGGMAQLGAQPPRIRVGSHAIELVFLAREPAPYRLAWGGTSPNAALPLSQLIPALKTGDALPASIATVNLAAPPPIAASTPQPAASAAAPQPSRKLWLWAVLLLALAAMGAMAWSLLKRPSPVDQG